MRRGNEHQRSDRHGSAETKFLSFVLFIKGSFTNVEGRNETNVILSVAEESRSEESCYTRKQILRHLRSSE